MQIAVGLLQCHLNMGAAASINELQTESVTAVGQFFCRLAQEGRRFLDRIVNVSAI